MRTRLGCKLSYVLPQPTPMIALLNVHFSRFGDLDHPDYLTTKPSVPIDSYRDAFGNWCTRLVAPAGQFVLTTGGVFRDDGRADPRNNSPRIGRILIARGRDAADVPLTHTFGPNELTESRVWTDEIE